MVRADIYRFLGQAFAEIRTLAKDGGEAAIGDMAELFQPLPIELARAADGLETYESIRLRVRRRAFKIEFARWLDTVVADQARWYSSDAELLHQLLYVALIDIRMNAFEANDRQVFCLADVFHNIPLRLWQAVQGRDNIEAIRHYMRDRARVGCCEQWLEQAIREVARSAD